MRKLTANMTKNFQTANAKAELWTALPVPAIEVSTELIKALGKAIRVDDAGMIQRRTVWAPCSCGATIAADPRLPTESQCWNTVCQGKRPKGMGIWGYRELVDEIQRADRANLREATAAIKQQAKAA